MHEGHKGTRFAVVAVCGVLFSAFAIAQNSPAAPKTLFVRCGKLIFDTEKPPISPAAVIITDGKITAAGANLAAPAGAQQVDFSRYTVLPGLLDAHMHLWTGPRVMEQPSIALAT